MTLRDRMLLHTVRAMGVLYLCILGVMILGTAIPMIALAGLGFSLVDILRVLQFTLLVPLALTVLASPLCLLYGAIATKDEARRHPRTEDGHCFRCGYDLAGLEPEAVCPECGGRENA